MNKFEIEAAGLLKTSDSVGDGWKWKIHHFHGAIARGYLEKTVFRPASKPGTGTTHWTYHVLFSESYSAPVIYFNARYECGYISFGLGKGRLLNLYDATSSTSGRDSESQ
jgi:hypothetical protein